MPAPVCVNCNVSYRVEKSGGYVIEMFSNPPKPYKIWSADGWMCPGCGHKIMNGFGRGPIAEHYQEDFQAILERVVDLDWCVESFEHAEDAHQEQP